FEKRLKMVLDYLNTEIQLLKIKKKIHTDISHEINESEKKYMLRQELKAIKKELGEGEPSAFGLEGMMDPQDIKDLTKRVKDAKMPADVEKIAKKELDRLKKIIPISPEYSVSRTYIEWLCDMPWVKSCPTKVDVKKARKILDKDHYGLEKIKERILEFLSVCQLNETCGATILCFVGPPGVGKTSLGQSIARALGRSFVHSSLGGMHDEADIRGHRRTYVGALPGRIIQGLKRAGFNDPVFMLDEIDKVGKDFQGDPASALLEVLDPEQNNEFTDHYLDVPFDLSKVFFILTANVMDTVPPALADRMEIIELPGYTEEEKLEIAKRYLIPRQLKGNGLEKHPFKMSDAAILFIIRKYTYEAGLRELERKIGALCRKIAKDYIEKKKKVTKLDAKDIEGYLGVEIYEYDVKQEEDMVGVSTGLAWTPYGGDIIFVESTRMPGDKSLILTGNLGEVMQESARAALSYIRSNADKFNIDSKKFEKSDIHIHVPEGATPKDGPSAGITICTSLISLLSGQKVRRDVAMTGEVTLTGRILAIGGLKEKILAAKRALIKTIIIPEKNKKDLKEIPKQILKDVTIKFAKTLDDVLKVAIIGKLGGSGVAKKAAEGAPKHKIPKLKVKIIRKKPVPENK
ncbi:endopeptidase La, partial [Patescibacteria group bacterium]|nr:endopeptidase La [Patescibacteria group bacterium]